MNYTITFSQQEMQVINDALMQMPYYKAAPVIEAINRQLLRQDKDLINSDTESSSVEKQ